MTVSQRVLAALSGLRIAVVPKEFEIHDEIEKALQTAGVEYRREAVIGPGCRIDFLVEGGIGIEVKKGRPSRGKLLEQADRYCRCEAVGELMLVVEKNASLPAKIAGKSCRVIRLHALWGVALP